MVFTEQLTAAFDIILENRYVRPAAITTRRGTVIRADHARVVSLPSGAKMLVAGLRPGRYQQIHTGHNGSFVKRMRDFYGVPRYIPTQNQASSGDDLDGECRECHRHYQECMDEPCSYPCYDYDLHRNYITTRLFEKIITMYIDNVRDIKWL
jgi:hypothetical protein